MNPPQGIAGHGGIPPPSPVIHHPSLLGHQPQNPLHIRCRIIGSRKRDVKMPVQIILGRITILPGKDMDLIPTQGDGTLVLDLKGVSRRGHQIDLQILIPPPLQERNQASPSEEWFPRRYRHRPFCWPIKYPPQERRRPPWY